MMLMGMMAGQNPISAYLSWAAISPWITLKQDMLNGSGQIPATVTIPPTACPLTMMNDTQKCLRPYQKEPVLSIHQKGILRLKTAGSSWFQQVQSDLCQTRIQPHGHLHRAIPAASPLLLSVPSGRMDSAGILLGREGTSM